eukprot:4716213-Prymnesium_polylepis.1
MPQTTPLLKSTPVTNVELLRLPADTYISNVSAKYKYRPSVRLSAAAQSARMSVNDMDEADQGR